MKSKLGTLSHQDMLNLCAVVLAGALSLFLKSKPIFLGVVLGGLLMTANFYALKKISAKLIQSMENEASSNIKIQAGIMFALKIVGLFLGAFVILKYAKVNTLAFGLSACALVLMSSFTARLK